MVHEKMFCLALHFPEIKLKTIEFALCSFERRGEDGYSSGPRDTVVRNKKIENFDS